jgi:tetratricopeptide (TPR) repeat protein
MDQQQDITPLENKAIHANLNNDWKQAIELNLEIIRIFPKNLASLNRLGVAYLKTSQAQLARKTFNKVLKLNPQNTIALKNLSKLKLQPKDTNSIEKDQPKTTLVNFIEEPGISKIVPLIKPGSPTMIANLTIGDAVTLKPSARRIKAFSEDTKEYIGRLPDDLSLSLSKFIKSGYKYQVVIKSINPQFPQIFIQEIKRSKRLKDTPSFPMRDGKRLVEILPGTPVSHPLEIFDPLTQPN